jgi:hypothetical protein
VGEVSGSVLLVLIAVTAFCCCCWCLAAKVLLLGLLSFALSVLLQSVCSGASQILEILVVSRVVGD